MNLEQTYQTLSAIDGVKYGWSISGKHFLPQTLQGFINDNLIICAQKYGFSLEETESIQKQKPSELCDNDAILFGYIQTLRMVYEEYDNLIFEERLIRMLHEKILRYSHIDMYKKGQYSFNAHSSSQNVMGMLMGKQSAPPVQQDIARNIEKYHDPLNDKNPLLKIFDFMNEFINLSPFREANEEVSDILITLLMLKQGYEFVKWSPLPLQKKGKFNLESFLRDLKDQALLSIDITNQDTIEHLLSPKQTLLWEWACQNKSKMFSRKDAVGALNFPERTVEEIIKKLTLIKRLTRVGEGKATRYKVV